jgi:hypothetical protein
MPSGTDGKFVDSTVKVLLIVPSNIQTEIINPAFAGFFWQCGSQTDFMPASNRSGTGYLDGQYCLELTS